MSPSSGDELIDVALYYGSEELKDARLVHYVQLKHSTERAEDPWTASGLEKTIKGFAKRYSDLLRTVPVADVRQKVRFSFTTNRPIDSKVRETLEDLANAREPRHTRLHATLLGYTLLNNSLAADFFHLFSADGAEPGLWEQRNLLARDVMVYLAEADYDSPVQLKELVARKATSEFAHDPAIRQQDVLLALKSFAEDLLPAPCRIDSPPEELPREQEAEIREVLLAARHPIVVHADGGIGKSVLALRLAKSMPSGSVAVLYDCFGDGLYRNPLHFRHRHRDALVQISNELASQGLCDPLIPSANADCKHYMRAFMGRLIQALRILRARDPGARLCLIIDAADNADMAAEEHGGTAFVRDLIRADFPEGVRVAFTCRTHRLSRLNPPPDSFRIELRPFSQAETTSHLRRTYPLASDMDATEFAFLSSSNPRVQALALSPKLPLHEMLRGLGPTPATVERTIGDLLQHAIDKLKDQLGQVESAQTDLICQALAVLRPPVPIPVLAQISNTPESAIRTFAFDMGRPLRLKAGSLHFLDEPTETWFRDRFKPDSENLSTFLKRLRPLAAGNSYVASTLPQLLLAAGFLDELVQLALSDDRLPTANPLERRDVQVQRLAFALKACLQEGRYVDASKLALKAGGEAAGEGRQMRLIQDNTDLAAALLAPERIDELVSRRTFSGGWMGARHAYDAGLLSGRNEFLPEARSRLRMALDWLDHWGRLPPQARADDSVDDADRAELAMAQLLALGPGEAARFLASWNPRHVALPASKRLARRLLDLGRYEQLDALALHGAKDVWLMLGLVAEASRVGHVLPAEPVARLMRALANRRAPLAEPTSWDSRWDVLAAVTASISTALHVLPREDAAWAGTLRRYLPDKPPPDLAARFGSDRSPLLRAYALEAALRGEALSLLAIAPPEVRKDLEKRGTSSGNSDTIAFELGTGGVLPWFVLNAEIACGRNPSDLNQATRNALEVTSRAASQDYHKQFDVGQVAAVEWTCALRDAAAMDDHSVGSLRNWLAGKDNILWPDTLISMCRIAARANGLSDLALELAVAAFESLEGSREDAEARCDSYQRLARAVFAVSPSEATAYFNRAVEISSRIGDEYLDRWSALLHLAEASAGQGQHRPQSAYRLARVAELTYEYVARDKYFDWERTVEALLGLCAPSTLAILSRWRDRNFGYAARLLRTAVYGLVRAGRLPFLVPVALSALNGDWNRLDDLKRALDAETNPDRRRLILGVAYRFMRIDPQSVETWAGLSELSRTHGANLPDVERLLAAARATADVEASNSEPTHLPRDPVQRSEPDWDKLFAGVDLANPESLRRAYADLRTFEPPIQFEEFYRQGFRRSGTGKMADFVNAIATWPDLDVFDLRYLLDAVPESAPKLLSLHQALHDTMLAACRNTPEHVRRRGWGSIFERLVGGGIVTDNDVVDAVLEGFTAQITTLDGGELFLLLDPLASRLTPDEADHVLNFGLDLLEGVLRPEDGDGPWQVNLTPPPSCEEALAGYLWVTLGSPVAAERWEAAHAVRTCVELSWTSLLSALADRATAGSAEPFADRGLVFYAWHARQWLLIGLARGALEHPAAVLPFVPFLNMMVREEHVLLRHFASQTLLTLNAAGVVPASDTACLDPVNVSSLPLTEYAGWREDSPDSDASGNPALTDEEKYYFGLDVESYWFPPLARAFGIGTDSVERRARQVLRERLGVEFGRDQDDARHKRKIFTGQDTHHSHGSRPRVDDLRTYHAHHAMMIVASRLLKTHSVWKSSDRVENDFEEWLQEQLPVRNDGRWVSDRRDPCVPEATQRPKNYLDKTWCWSITSGYLDRQLLTDDGLQALWGDWSRGQRDDRESVSVRSALVGKAGAAALLAAAQTSPSGEGIHFPREHEDEDDSPEAVPFQLTGWVGGYREVSGVDEYDPWGEALEYPGPMLGTSAIDALGLTPIDDGRRWVTASGSLLRSETWTRTVGLGREKESVAGTRLSCSGSLLHELFKARPSDCLIVSVSVSRRPTRYNSGGDEVEPYPLPYVRYYLIGEDGIARALKGSD